MVPKGTLWSHLWNTQRWKIPETKTVDGFKTIKNVSTYTAYRRNNLVNTANETHHLSHLNSRVDRVPVDFINGHPIPRWVAAIRHGREGPGITPNRWNASISIAMTVYVWFFYQYANKSNWHNIIVTSVSQRQYTTRGERCAQFLIKDTLHYLKTKARELTSLARLGGSGIRFIIRYDV